MADQEHHGSTALSLEERLAVYADGLRKLAVDEEAKVADLQTRLKAARKQVQRINNAIRELTGESEKQNSGKLGPPKGKPRAATLDKVLTALADAGEQGATYLHLETATGLSHDAIARAIVWLRKEDKVRHAGVDKTTGSGNRPIFKLMPEAAEESDRLALAG